MKTRRVVTIWTGHSMDQRRVIPIGEYLWVELQEVDDPKVDMVVKVLCGGTGFLDTHVYACSDDSMQCKTNALGYARIAASELIACRKFTLIEAPLTINWTWISKVFKKEMYSF